MTCTCRDDFDEIIHENNPTKHCGLVFYLDYNPTTLIEIAVYVPNIDSPITLLRREKGDASDS